MTPQRRNLRRFHKYVYFPAWYEKSLKIFSQSILEKGALTFSLHAMEKTFDYGYEYGRSLFKYLVKIIRNGVLNTDNVFEFYSVERFVTKACFRYSLEGFPVDLILVISADGVVITLYVAVKGDNHYSLDKRLYEKGE